MGNDGALERWGWDRNWAQEAIEAGGDCGSATGAAAADGPAAFIHPARRLSARVVRHSHHHYEVVAAPEGERVATTVSGAFSYRAAGPADYPTVGDWVLLDGGSGRIEVVLRRRTAISRSTAGDESLEQVIAANIDVLFLVFGLDGGRNYTTGMLERSLVAARGSGVRPVVVLNKCDCADDSTIEKVESEVRRSAPDLSVHVVSAVNDAGIDALLGEASPGETIGMLGKSGVGKSALVNACLRSANCATEPAARTGAQRSDGKGRHTTSDKQFYLLPSGAIIADVPGLRELKLWGDVHTLDSAFPDIEELAAECRFSDCRHNGEPDCRVREALATGELSLDRFSRYLDYLRELAFLERRRDQRALLEERKKRKQIAQHSRRFRKGG